MTKSRLYTRTGDDGTTALVGGSREMKTSPRIEAYGTVDELNSWIGLVTCAPEISKADTELLGWVQMRLFDIGSYLACPEPEPGDEPMLRPGVGPGAMARIEAAIDRLDASTPPARRFVLPGGSVSSANAQIARCVARRAERRILSLHSQAPVDIAVRQFVNRLSDYLFILGRHINHLNGSPEIFWERDDTGDPVDDAGK